MGGDLPIHRNVDDVAFSATDIIRAEVLDSRTELILTALSDPETLDDEILDMFTQIHTIHRIRVLEVFRGESEAGDILEVMQPGGIYGSRELIYDSRMLFEYGDELVFFARNFRAFGFGHLPMGLMHPFQSVYRAAPSDRNAASEFTDGIVAAFNENPNIANLELQSFSPFNEVVLTVHDLVRIQYESGLGPPINRENLNAAIAAAELFTGNGFTRLNWVLLQDALDHARLVVNNEHATQVQVDAALNRLNSAKANRQVVIIPIPIKNLCNGKKMK